MKAGMRGDRLPGAVLVNVRYRDGLVPVRLWLALRENLLRGRSRRKALEPRDFREYDHLSKKCLPSRHMMDGAEKFNQSKKFWPYIQLFPQEIKTQDLTPRLRNHHRLSVRQRNQPN